MKYKNDYVNKLEAALNLLETMQKALESNAPFTKGEIVQLNINVQKMLTFILERLELESD